MNFKYDFDEDHYHELCLTPASAKRRLPSLSATLSHCYKTKLPVSKAKKDDLLSLCRSGVIPEEHRAFYRALPTATVKQDHLEEPDFHDSGEDTD